MKNTLSLNGEWQISGVNEGEGNWELPGSLLPEGAQELVGHVPGEVHVDLLRAGLIPDPYYAMNGDQVQWVEEKEWWYKKTFEVDEDFLCKKTFLEFDGLDTYATIFLNGEKIGQTEDMFVPHRFDVSKLIHPGRNTVAVEFDPAAKIVERMDYSNLFGCFNTPRVNARKMQCAFGWDWTHRFVGAGIWRDARLVSYDLVSISDVYVDTELEGNIANAWITISVDNNSGKSQMVMGSVVVSLGETQEKIEIAEEVSPFGGLIEAVIRIHEPQLWWPNGFGEPTLYTCMVGLEVEGEIQDVAERKFGVRDIAIVELDERGNNVFTLMINGEEIFCKGGNWIPADHFVSSATPERYRELVQMAKDANFNMLRVWGGGIYEHPAFYEACNEMGIMVWQDFMFSCGRYRDDEEFCRNVAQETTVAIKMLRNHPCIVIWSGNNECEMHYGPDQEWQGKKLFYEVIPNVLKTLDHSRPYRPSSPYGGSPANCPEIGDWHGGSWFNVYYSDISRWRHMIEKEAGHFVSEFATQGPPEIDSLRKFIPEDSLFPPTNDIYEYHNKDNPHSGRTDGLTHEAILAGLTSKMIGDYDTPEKFAAYGSILQGEFLKAEIEHYRREKWDISGCMFWMYNDCWPAVSWSVVDYYLRPKAAYYYAKRAYAPVILSFKQLEDRVQLYVTSDDRMHDIVGKVEVGVFSFGTCGYSVQEIPVSVRANSSAAVWESEPLDQILTDPAHQCLVAMLVDRGEVVARNVYLPCLFREMEFPLPKLLVEREQLEENVHQMTIAADSYARNVVISNLPASARPSDNYFDLLPGERYTVKIENLSIDEANSLKINVWGK